MLIVVNSKITTVIDSVKNNIFDFFKGLYEFLLITIYYNKSVALRCYQFTPDSTKSIFEFLSIKFKFSINFCKSNSRPMLTLK